MPRRRHCAQFSKANTKSPRPQQHILRPVFSHSGETRSTIPYDFFSFVEFTIPVLPVAEIDINAGADLLRLGQISCIALGKLVTRNHNTHQSTSIASSVETLSDNILMLAPGPQT